MTILRKLARLKDAPGEDLALYVGDTRTLTFTIKDSTETVVNLAGKTLRLRANTDGNVGSSSNLLFQVSGTIVGDGSTGKVQFALTPTELAVAAEDAHFYLIDITSSAQLVLMEQLADIRPEPDAS